MPLSAGSRFGAFEILTPLGAGAMGEVYRSRDTRLQRDVALKVLPDAVALDPDRLARFTREAQMLAALNHPNIAAIHGVEQDGERHALVLELVDGPTLAERIAQGALPIEEALLIARQLAEALEAAHEQGIIHRDLKPANIKLRADGTVKVLDFGLAKAIAHTDSATAAPRLADVTASPTVFAPATMTTAGVILGTAAYMAPEQARGRALDRRADIWAFGCVLFEMLAGRRAFDGEEVTDVLASVLRDGPRWDALPPDTPAIVRKLLRRCLEKDPRERLQAIGDARIEITDALHPTARRDEPVVIERVQPRVRPLPLVIACMTTALIVATATWTLKPDATADGTAVTRSLIAVDPFDRRPEPADGVIGFTSRNAVALSPDGRVLAFRANAGGAVGWQLYLRRLDRLEAVPIPDTSGAENPFFSPDGSFVGYADGGELRRAPVAGGPATTIARLTGRIQGASWGDGDLIVFATTEGMWRVRGSGGTPESVGETAADEYRRVFPHVLPGGGAVLFTRQRTVFRWDDAQILVRSLSTGEEKVLLDDAADARYVPSGHLLFMRRGTLMAVPFDPDRLELAGGVVAVIPDVMQAANIGNSGDDTGAGQFATSVGGSLVYITGGVFSDDERELVWVDRSGTVEPIPAPKREYVSAARISPDGTRILAFTSASVNEGGSRLWAYDVTRRAMTPISPPDERVSWALWSPDGSRVAYMTLLAGGAALSLRAADGTGTAERLNVEGNLSSWSRDDRIALVQGTPTTRSDIWVLDLKSVDRKAQPLLQTAADERYPVFSPDGKWLAFVSDESGRPDVYIQPYPGPGPRVLVSPTGGIAPAWRGDGAELFYTLADAGGVSVRAVAVSMTPSGVTVGMPRLLFEGQYSSGSPARGYDVTADGQRFVMVRVVNTRPPESNQMVLVENSFEELKQLAPPAR